MDWDQYFMSFAYLAAMKSKDRGAKVGAIIVDPEHEVVATGYNGFPRGFNDDIEERHEKPLKFNYTIHAEPNAIISAARRGLSTKGCRMYITWCPCDKCAVVIVQSGIKEVIFHKENPVSESWNASIALAKEMLTEGGVVYREWSGTLVQPVIFAGGEIKENPLDAK